MILKLKSTSVDIGTTPGTVDNASVVSVINTTASPVVIDVNGNSAHIAAGERVVFEKEPTHVIGAGAALVYASAIAYSVS